MIDYVNGFNVYNYMKTEIMNSLPSNNEYKMLLFEIYILKYILFKWK